MSDSTPRVVVVGGGFAGMNAALRLASIPFDGQPKPAITLIDRSERFTFLPMLYELATGEVAEWEVAPKHVELLKDSGVDFVHGEVCGLDTATKELRYTPLAPSEGNGDCTLSYDKLVLSIGAQAIAPPVAGVQTFATYDDAMLLRSKLAVLKASSLPLIRILIVGTSYSGVELATTLARYLGPRRALVSLAGRSQTLMESSEAPNREAARDALSRAGVEVLLGQEVTLLSPTKAQLKAVVEPATEGDEVYDELEAELVVWCAGSKTDDRVAERFGLPTTEAGRVSVLKTLQCTGEEDVYALGDVSLCDDLKGTSAAERNAQVAVQQADYAAFNIWASLTGRAQLPFRYTKLGEMLSLGQNDASVSLPGGAASVRGLPAAAVRRAAYLFRMPTNLHRAKVGFSWGLDALLTAVGGGKATE